MVVARYEHVVVAFESAFLMWCKLPCVSRVLGLGFLASFEQSSLSALREAFSDNVAELLAADAAENRVKAGKSCQFLK